MTSTASNETRNGWLIVEDESLIAMLIEEAIAELGLPIVGPVANVAEALDLIRRRPPEGAILDVNLAGEQVYPVADALASRNIPFAFLTGYGESGVRQDFRTQPILRKPFDIDQIKSTVRQLQGGSAMPKTFVSTPNDGRVDARQRGHRN